MSVRSQQRVECLKPVDILSVLNEFYTPTISWKRPILPGTIKADDIKLDAVTDDRLDNLLNYVLYNRRTILDDKKVKNQIISCLRGFFPFLDQFEHHPRVKLIRNTLVLCQLTIASENAKELEFCRRLDVFYEALKFFKLMLGPLATQDNLQNQQLFPLEEHGKDIPTETIGSIIMNYIFCQYEIWKQYSYRLLQSADILDLFHYFCIKIPFCIPRFCGLFQFYYQHKRDLFDQLPHTAMMLCMVIQNTFALKQDNDQIEWIRLLIELLCVVVNGKLVSNEAR